MTHNNESYRIEDPQIAFDVAAAEQLHRDYTDGLSKLGLSGMVHYSHNRDQLLSLVEEKATQSVLDTEQLQASYDITSESVLEDVQTERKVLKHGMDVLDTRRPLLDAAQTKDFIGSDAWTLTAVIKLPAEVPEHENSAELFVFAPRTDSEFEEGKYELYPDFDLVAPLELRGNNPHPYMVGNNTSVILTALGVQKLRTAYELAREFNPDPKSWENSDYDRFYNEELVPILSGLNKEQIKIDANPRHVAGTRKSVVVGRSSSAELSSTFKHVPYVSGKHLEISSTSGSDLILRDDSTNGTVVITAAN